MGNSVAKDVVDHLETQNWGELARLYCKKREKDDCGKLLNHLVKVPKNLKKALCRGVSDVSSLTPLLMILSLDHTLTGPANKWAKELFLGHLEVEDKKTGKLVVPVVCAMVELLLQLPALDLHMGTGDITPIGVAIPQCMRCSMKLLEHPYFELKKSEFSKVLVPLCAFEPYSYLPCYKLGPGRPERTSLMPILEYLPDKMDADIGLYDGHVLLDLLGCTAPSEHTRLASFAEKGEDFLLWSYLVRLGKVDTDVRKRFLPRAIVLDKDILEEIVGLEERRREMFSLRYDAWDKEWGCDMLRASEIVIQQCKTFSEDELFFLLCKYDSAVSGKPPAPAELVEALGGLLRGLVVPRTREKDVHLVVERVIASRLVPGAVLLFQILGKSAVLSLSELLPSLIKSGREEADSVLVLNSYTSHCLDNDWSNQLNAEKKEDVCPMSASVLLDHSSGDDSSSSDSSSNSSSRLDHVNFCRKSGFPRLATVFEEFHKTP
mmetsp:Transcript_36257/g.102154  ORF Transcript_36257/g.102154 Transcript_36257/m.102154 type:complete len:491 (-) Transcript_36257:18-1490(-)|eukprot:CAMPEP_0119130350 /NCGR_PEP_ID=MMETSP1310-20130426/7724_1 /TAXON_ID=464262 /ORGANISM="Genus nov. species nov., Strain RCC2339" /LENGTH=490 /DNA_ID=CAMNT_0007120851 /DNA_START=148 /DNA_END=1620 /DNA_ORIENTATION=-